MVRKTQATETADSPPDRLWRAPPLEEARVHQVTGHGAFGTLGRERAHDRVLKLGSKQHLMSAERLLRSIVSSPEVFAQQYLPARLCAREVQATQIQQRMLPGLRRLPARHAWLCGPPGSGKTATARSVVAGLGNTYRFHQVAINCWEQSSLYLVLSKILDDLRVLHTDVRDTSFKRDRLIRFLKGEPLILILDEIDKPVPQERNAILYTLASMNSVGLICIASNERLYLELEDRVRSRLAPLYVQCGPYSPSELVSILTQRATEGLRAGTWTVGLLEQIAVSSEGDARLSIQTLLDAALVAEERGHQAIAAADVQAVLGTRTHRADVLESLTEDHRILSGIVRERKTILSGALYLEYRARCAATDRRPMALRTFREYANDLVRAGVITTERTTRPGQERLFRPVE